MSNRSRNLFLEACGAAAPFRLVVEHPARPEPVYQTFALPFAVIGRDPHADLLLDDPAVSPRHAYVQMVAGRLWCVDLDSRTGTHWDDGSQEPGWLQGSRCLHIGPFRVRRADGGLDLSPAENTFNPLASHSPQAESLPAISLEFIDSPTQQRPYPMSRVLTLVGQGVGCKVRLVSPTVARFHCSLLRSRHGLWVVDLLGGGGIAVEDSAVPWARLDDGNQLKVGRFVLRIAYPPQPQAAAPAQSPRGKQTTLAAAGSAPPLPVESGPPPEAGPEPVSSHWPVSGRVQPLPLPASQSPILPAALDLDLPSLPGGMALANTELVQSVLVPLANQFSQMQQQMFDQFQQALLGVVQMFSGLHKEQFALIRHELDRLHELTRDLHALQAELARTPAPPAVAPLLSGPIGHSESAGNGSVPLFSTPDSSAPPDLSFERAASPVTSDPAPAPPETKPDAPAPSPGGASVMEPPGKKPPAPGPEQPVKDVHAWLEQRLAAIQQERQSRWRKLLNFILGKRGVPP